MGIVTIKMKKNYYAALFYVISKYILAYFKGKEKTQLKVYNFQNINNLLI